MTKTRYVSIFVLVEGFTLDKVLHVVPPYSLSNTRPMRGSTRLMFILRYFPLDTICAELFLLRPTCPTLCVRWPYHLAGVPLFDPRNQCFGFLLPKPWHTFTNPRTRRKCRRRNLPRLWEWKSRCLCNILCYEVELRWIGHR